MDPEKFGYYLRELRERRGLTIRQLEMLSGVSNSYISQIENGKKEIPSAKILKKLADPLRVSIEDLVRTAGHLDRPTISHQDRTIAAHYKGAGDIDEYGLNQLIERTVEKILRRRQQEGGKGGGIV